jgi:TonB-dependent SusC/RagA subfamily outer membrane receptor
MRKLIFLFACLFIAGVSLVLAQTSISGKVISGDDGEPIIGATVMVKGTTTGTITGANGEFSIVVTPQNRTLVVSFIGMVTEEVEATNNMTVTLRSSVSELDEVIITAFGSSTKKSFTGAAAVIKSEELSKNQSSNITNNLAGKVAGVQGLASNGQPGSGASIRIRGIGSMSSSNAPLYVVDGVPYDTDISAVNNADIESVTVLKDAASAALYGARGANGVIIITTKRGKGKDAQVKVDTKWGNNSRAIPAYNVMTDAGMYYENFYRAMYNSRVNKDGIDAAHEYANNYLLDAAEGGLGYQVYTVPNGERLIGTNFKLNPRATLGYSDGDFTYMPDKWFDEVFNPNNLRQEYNVSVSGSADKLTYFFSANYLHDTGIVSNSDFQRFSSRLNTDYQVKKWLKLVTNMSYIRNDSRYPDEQISDRSSGNLFFLSNMLAPVYPLYVRDADGNIMTDCRIYHEKTMGLFDISLKDFSKVVLLESDCAVSFLSPEITLDLGAYAKGYALQVIGGKLKKYNVLNAFLSFGDSSILGIGNHPYGNSWKVSVTNPFVHHEVLGEIDLQHTSLSTSGNSPSYSNHIVRPDSGRRNNERKLVCVVAGNQVDAEVLSTALMVATDQERQEILQNFEIESFKIYNIE